MSAGCYLLVRFDNKDSLLPAIKMFASDEQVLRWDAVDGHYSLVLKLAGDETSIATGLSKLDGYNSTDVCKLVADNDSKAEYDETKAYSYLFIEAEENKTGDLMKRLTAVDEVLFCSLTSGDCNLVAMAIGEQFGEIDRLVDDKVRMLDGVLRIRKDRILQLDRL